MITNQETIIQTGTDAKFFHNFIKGRKAVIISDTNVFNLYPELFFGYDKIIIEPGEKNKNLKTIDFVINELTKLNLDRNSIIIGLGGGMITDITGFVASIYMRGISFGFVPTTVLAQVDAAIGGKNGVNSGNLKNYVGTFNQPEFILCDSSFFNSLSEIEYYSGLGEVYKYSLITQGNRLFNYLRLNANRIIQKDNEVLNHIIEDCIDSKNAIVEQDPFDQGIRNTLNLGHTFGHAIEILNNVPHGIAVVHGIKIVCDISQKMGFLKSDVKNTILNLAEALMFNKTSIIEDKHIEIVLKDKKRNEDLINLVILKNIGEPYTHEISEKELRELLI